MKLFKMLMMAAFTIFSLTAFAQDNGKQKSKTKTQKMEKMKFACPMHQDATSDKPGKCSKCNMDMKEKATAVAYACPMKCEGDKTYDKAGKCPKCGMNLTEKKMEMGSMKTYSCPMHADMSSNKAGKCSKCNMDMKEKAVAAYACPMKCEGEKTYDKAGKCPVCKMSLTEKKDEHEGHNH